MDIHPYDSWTSSLEALAQAGFKIIHQRMFPRKDGSAPLQYGRSIIAAHVEDKLLLHAVSHKHNGQEVLYQGTIYGCAHRGSVSPSDALILFALADTDPVALPEFKFRFFLDYNPFSQIRKIRSAGVTFANINATKPLSFIDPTEERFLSLQWEEPEQNHAHPITVRWEEFLEIAPPEVLAFVI